MFDDEEIIKKRKNLGKEKKSLDTLFNAIRIEKPEGVTAEFIVENIMKMKGVKGPLCAKIAEAHIGDDPRFVFSGNVCRLREKPRASELFNAPAYCVFDIETTGLSPRQCGIIEIGAVMVSGDSIRGTFQSFVDPGEPIPPEITRITGIDDSMVAGAPPIGEVLPAFLDFVGDSVVVAHNAPFDLGFVNESLMARYSRKMINPIICTLKLSKMLFPSLESHSLDSVMNHFRITRDGASHRALDDARACSKVLLRLLKMMKESGGIK